ncbi:coiled-coil domain-containing protein 12 [Sphaerodactylus townsendi]|uniref:coiled-coil domain-containing protein 12 n=1 Tax=Sphaerodactylus townsendi TaxID=933632 RepID=UPI002025EE99|nr:coiled-coil domain-containing protein 12 [Sphaerodactylus townsendi]
MTPIQEFAPVSSKGVLRMFMPESKERLWDGGGRLRFPELLGRPVQHPPHPLNVGLLATPESLAVSSRPLVEDKVKDQLEAAKPEPIIEEVDLANLAPRKPDWDLKRDVAKKLEKLEKRTQRAIAELIRERLRGQEENLASAIDSAKPDESDSD